MHGHEIAFAVPGWLNVLLLGTVIYLIGAVLTGCPYCFMPNFRWPLELVAAVGHGLVSRLPGRGGDDDA